MRVPAIDKTGKAYRIYAQTLEAEALRQFTEAMQQESIIQAALMPDAHAGYTLPIGAVVAVQDMLYPSFVGYDIGCGMCAVQTSFSPPQIRTHATEIFKSIYRFLPVGFAHHKEPGDWHKIPAHTAVVKALMKKGGLNQLGTLGSGNHFVEIGEDEEKRIWIVVHSGSRNVGHSIATHYMKLAAGGKAREGFFGFRTDSVAGQEYLIDLQFAMDFALENRLRILQQVCHAIQQHISGSMQLDTLINRHHNHAEKSGPYWIHRKGATHAEKDMMGVIPGNMREGSFIVRGKGNPESLFSSSHGAGRLMGRKAAQKNLNLQHFRQQIEKQGITARIDKNTLDEAPDAYKDIYAVLDMQRDLIEICHHIRPIINIKG